MLQRELRVAFSKQHQATWVRVLKWIVIVAAIIWLHDTRFFWHGLVAVVAAALALHFFYRWKTNKWTRAWGGWNDVATANPNDTKAQYP